jgi:hypothetical protein
MHWEFRGTQYQFDAARIVTWRPEMARLARVVAARLPLHVTQRGNRRQPVFFGDDDYETYRGLLAEGCRAAGVAIWAYCLERVGKLLPFGARFAGSGPAMTI